MSSVAPIRPTDDEARALAQSLLSQARHGALGVIEPDTGAPMVSRVTVGRSPGGLPLALVSELSQHTRALRANPAASLLVGEPGGRGDPLNYPRLTIMAKARFVEHVDPRYGSLAKSYLEGNPKAKVYIGFADFVFVILDITNAYLNGGFGKAFTLTADDLNPNG